jgi:hypothetical protein
MLLRGLCLISALLLISSSSRGGDREDYGPLVEQLKAAGEKGKTSTRFILNRGIGDGKSEAGAQLAKELGFTNDDGSTTPAVLAVPMKDNADWIGAIKKLHEQGATKHARAIEVGGALEVLRDAVKEAKAKHAGAHAEFVAFLRRHKASSEFLGVKALEDAKLPSDSSKGPMHYFVERFYLEKSYESLREKSEAVHKLKPWLGVGGPYAGNFEENVDAQVLYAWKTRALTAPWVAEQSWQNGDFSPQGLGYYLALARNPALPNDILCDVHVGANHYADGVRRAFYLGIAQGAKGIRFAGVESMPPGHTAVWKTMRELGQEAAKFEHIVGPAKTRKADVGLVVSLTQELWDNSPWVAEERKALYQAARLGGHNVVILTDEDIQERRLEKLASIYYIGTHIQRDTASALKAWVIAGGSLGCVGGPFRDEYGNPFPEMMQFVGAAEYQWQPGEKAGPAKIALAQHKPLGDVEWQGKVMRKFPVVYGKLTWTPWKDEEGKPPETTVQAKYSDGKPAVHVRAYSPIAHVWLFGAPMGSGWFKTVLPPREWNVGAAPSNYNHRLLIRELNADMGDMVMGASGEAKWDVITDNLSIETILMEGQKGYALVCINWSTFKPQQAQLTVQFLPQGLERATSVESGQLRSTRRGIVLDFKVKVNVTDVVLIEQALPKGEPGK